MFDLKNRVQLFTRMLQYVTRRGVINTREGGSLPPPTLLRGATSHFFGNLYVRLVHVEVLFALLNRELYQFSCFACCLEMVGEGLPPSRSGSTDADLGMQNTPGCREISISIHRYVADTRSVRVVFLHMSRIGVGVWFRHMTSRQDFKLFKTVWGIIP